VAKYPYLVQHHKALFQQLSVLIRHGYLLWISGMVPEGKDPLLVDQKIITKYGIAVSVKQRVRLKREGVARLQYLRLGRLFILVATHGSHPNFFASEQVRHFKTHPFKAWSHSISFRGGHPHIRIPPDAYRIAKQYFAQNATSKSLKWWERKIQRFPWEPWAPIRRQAFNLIRMVNKLRKAARLKPIDWRVHYRLKRKSFKVFVES
jgi:hypothetical protein